MDASKGGAIAQTSYNNERAKNLDANCCSAGGRSDVLPSSLNW